MPLRDVNAVTRLAEASWRRDKGINWRKSKVFDVRDNVDFDFKDRILLNPYQSWKINKMFRGKRYGYAIHKEFDGHIVHTCDAVTTEEYDTDYSDSDISDI